MATVVTLNSPDELLTYLNANTQTGAFLTDWFVVDKGARYTVIETTPFVVTTLDSEIDLKAFIESGLTGTIKSITPKKSGGKLTFISLANETPLVQTHTMIICKDPSELDAAMDAAGVNTAIIEHNNFSIVIKD